MASNVVRSRGRDPFQKKNLEQFLHGKTKNTADAYRTGLVKYLAWVYQEEEVRRVDRRIDVPHYNDLSLRYLEEYTTPDEHAALLADFIEDHRAIHAPKMLSSMKGAVVQYLAANKIFLAPQQVRRIRTGNRPVTADRIPDREEIRNILSHGDLLSRTYVLVLVSSGMRPGEPLSLTWEDVDLDRGMVKIAAGVAKNNVGRVTFLSKEAMESLRELRNYSQKLCVKIERQTGGRVIPDRNYVFPVTYGAMTSRFALMVEKAGLDERDKTSGRLTIHLHCFRKYFRTHMAKGEGGNAIDVVEALLGHEGYLSGAYVRLTIQELEAFYRKNEHLLWIYRTKPINEKELKQLENENRHLRDEIVNIQRQVAAMAAMHADLNANPDALRRLVDERIKTAMDGRE